MAAPEPDAAAALLVRVDAMAMAVTHTDADGTRFEVTPEALQVTAARACALPLFSGWSARGALALRLHGVATGSFDAQLEIAGARVGVAAHAAVDPLTGAYALELTAPLAALSPLANGVPVKLALALAGRTLLLTRVVLVAVEGAGPAIAAFDLRDATDAMLFHAPERQRFDLQNPEEGFWLGSGQWQLRLLIGWEAPAAAAGWSLDPLLAALEVDSRRGDGALDLLFEDPSQRAGEGAQTRAALTFNTSHASLRGTTPPQGADVAVALGGAHALRVGALALRLAWQRNVALRVRDPLPSLAAFRRLSAVGIDFGTTATVAAFTQRGYRALMRLGTPEDGANPAENPTVLLIEDHAALWATMGAYGEAQAPGARRHPPIAGLVQASHSARARIGEAPNAVVSEIKSLPERVVLLDQSPQLRDRARGSDFLLDEARVRMLVRAYAYILGRAINRPGQDVFLHYWLTYPAEFDERARALLEEELRAGILLSIPEGIDAAEVTVGMRATEPEAYAAEVCDELVSHPAIAPLVAKHGELRFAVFDFGGGTLDIACGRYRPATPAEEAASGCSSVIETLQVGGNDHLGGDYLTHELAWLCHQHEAALPEMEAKEVPMQRPQTVPENKLARAAQLYKRSLAGRQNKLRFERELALEAFKRSRADRVRAAPGLRASRLDGGETELTAFSRANPALEAHLEAHLEARIREGARLLAQMLASTPWGGTGSWREQGVMILLAGNSSRGEYVAAALGSALGVPELKVWRPESDTAPEASVVLYETPTRVERGVEISGVTPKTAVALGALKIANREVHLVRAQQGFSYFVGDMRGFPPRFTALIGMGALPANPAEWGPHYVEFGTWDAQKPLRIATEFEPGKMSSNDPRMLSIPTGLPPGSVGRLFVCVVAPSRIALHLALADGQAAVRSELNLAPYVS